MKPFFRDSAVLLGRIFVPVLLLCASATQAALPVPPPPPVAARGFVLMDFQSGRVLAENQADARMEPASLTKLMTAYIVFGELRAGHVMLQDLTPISEHAWRMEGSRTFLNVNTQVAVEDLLKGMIVQSGNDATVALAERVGGTEDGFVTLMNHQAQALGMTNTHYMNAAGMPDPQHYTTARDLSVLARALIAQYPDYYKYYSIKEFTYNGITQPNRNLLLARDPTVDGVKTGHTDTAGYCLIASAQRQGMRLISVVLGTASDNARANESQKLLSYGFLFYETQRLYNAGQTLTQARIWKGAQDQLPLGLNAPLYVTLPRGRGAEVKASMSVVPALFAPAAKGQAFGALNITLAGEKIATQPLVALAAVPEGGLFRRAVDTARLWFK